MSPQFVDFDADGHTDLFAATFDGSPHVAYGGAEGFLAPEHVLDPDGQRVVLGQFWNDDTSRWDEADESDGHCTSALAFDWDGDGDLDLLMGDYKTGKLFRRMNTGSAQEPSYPGPNVAVEVGGAQLELEGGLASPHIADWDGDGLADLLLGGYGDPYAEGPGAGVFWCRNTGEPGAPRFAAPQALIEPSEKTARGAVRPDAGLHLDTVDWDSDGRLDLLVGGYSIWKPEAPDLSPEQRARAAKLEAAIGEQHAARTDMLRNLDPDLTDEARTAAWKEIVESDDYRELEAAREVNQTELDRLRPPIRRETAVWLYRRTG